MIDLHVDTEAFRQEMEQVRHWLEMWLEQDHCSFVAEANAAKGVMSQDEFVQLCRDVASFTQRNRGWEYTSVEECMEDTVLDTPVVGSSDE